MILPGSKPKFSDGHAVFGGPPTTVETTVTVVLAQPDETAAADVVEWAQSCGLRVVASSPHARTVVVEGTVDRHEEAFGVQLLHFHEPDLGYFRSHRDAITIPDHLDGKVLAILGLDSRPAANPHYRKAPVHKALNVPPGTFLPAAVGQAYGFPAVPDPGHGQCIGILELGGGYRVSDLRTFFAAAGLPMPNVVSIGVDNGRNAPGDPDGADGEVMLDIEVAASIAPHARIAVYFAPNTDQGFHDGIMAAAHDHANRPGVLSISWGGPESSWSQQAIAAMGAAIKDAVAAGITVLVAAGDDGSSDGGKGNNVDYPGSDPNSLCCGGTKLVVGNGSIESETVWGGTADDGATGGGYSDLFPMPSYQHHNAGTGRGVPDLAGNADPDSGYYILVDGQWGVIGGTSAVAPLFAGLITLRNQAKTNLSGFINPLLYGNPAAFRDITAGSNGAFSAGPGWDACSGLGVPIGATVAAL